MVTTRTYTTTMPIHRATLVPLDHLVLEERLAYDELSLAHGLPRSFPLGLLRRRGYWASTLPPQVWGREDLSFIEEETLRQQAERARKDASLPYGYVRGRDCFAQHERWFYRDSPISALLSQFAMPLLATAVMRFLHAAEDPSNNLVVRPKRSARPYIEPENRIVYGERRHRGPAWTPEHDLVLRKWFGRHEYGPNKGKHAPLTPQAWVSVLLELGGKRSKSEVHRRILFLNQELRVSLTEHGYVPRLNIDRYLREALGEHSPRLPHRREPLKAERKRRN